MHTRNRVRVKNVFLVMMSIVYVILHYSKREFFDLPLLILFAFE